MSHWLIGDEYINALRELSHEIHQHNTGGTADAAMRQRWLDTIHQINAGVSSGARRVVTAAMATDSARSPRASQVITLEEVPLGQQPTRITPTAISG